jgi:hypothetical protein
MSLYVAYRGRTWHVETQEFGPGVQDSSFEIRRLLLQASPDQRKKKKSLQDLISTGEKRKAEHSGLCIPVTAGNLKQEKHGLGGWGKGESVSKTLALK